MHFSIPIYDTCVETKGAFNYLTHVWKTTPSVVQNLAPFGQKAL